MILSERIEGEIIQHEAENADFTHQYDVIVVGLGSAGAIAVIQAAMKGLKVLGIEKLNGMGGTGTIGAVFGYYFGSTGGYFETIDQEVREMEAEGYTITNGINPELKKYILEQHAVQYGAAIRFESILTGVFMEDKKVTGIQWFDASGFHQAKSKVVIDCTADAEVCAMANCETKVGRSLDQNTQPHSCVKVQLKNDRVTKSYTDCGYMDQRDGKLWANAIVESPTLSFYLKDYYDEEERLLYLSPLHGIREGRFIEGEEKITLKDYLNDNVSDKPLFYAYSNVDNHGKDVALEDEAQQDWIIGAGLWGINFSVPVPLGALIPKGFEGILVAGRCLSVDHNIAPCVRMQRDMQKCGEAAALAAYIAIQKNIALKDVPYEELLPMLKETKCFDVNNNVGMKNIVSNDEKLNTPFTWMTDSRQIRETLATEKPGIAIWSAKRLGQNIRKDLKNWLKEGNEHLVKNSAIALALIGDKDALPVLRTMVKQRDAFLPSTSRKYNQVHAHTAIYLLGKLHDKNSVPMLLDIITKPESCDNIHKIYNEFIANDDEYYFQYFSQSLIALLKIGEEYPETRNEIADVLRKRVFDQNFSVIITFKGGSKIKYSMTGKIRWLVQQQLEKWG